MQKLPAVKIGTVRPITAIAISRSELEHRREAMLSLPGWAASRIGWLGTVTVDRTTSHYLTTGLPQLTHAERATIDHQVALLDAVVSPGADDAERKLVLITKMLMALTSANLSEPEAAARGEAYLYAVSDIPAWAVEEAIQNWYRGKVRDVPEADMKWAPAPALLLRACRDVLAPYIEVIVSLRRLLDAKPLLDVLGQKSAQPAA